MVHRAETCLCSFSSRAKMLARVPAVFPPYVDRLQVFSADGASWRPNVELDDFDRRLLNLVQLDAGQTAEQLAGSVGLSASAVQRRLKRLREAGVILREAAVVDLKSVGCPTFFVTALQIERERPELIAQLRTWLMAQEHVQQIYYVTGQ